MKPTGKIHRHASRFLALALLTLASYASVAAPVVLPAPPPAPVPAVGFLPPPQTVCAEDRQKFCSNVEAGYARVDTCLRAYKNRLAPACKTFLDNVQAAKAAAGHADQVDSAEE